MTPTGDTNATKFYVMYEKWPDVGDFAFVALAPVSEVEDVKFLDPAFIDVTIVEGERSTDTTILVVFASECTLDVMVSRHTLPRWIQLIQVAPMRQVAKVGESF